MSSTVTTKTRNLNIRTSEDDYNAIKNFAAFQGETLSRFVMNAALEKIEEWEDIQAVKAYEREKRENLGENLGHEAFMKELALR